MEENKALTKVDQNTGEIQSMAKLFAESGYFPDVKSIAQAFVKIIAGRELGIPAMAAMTGISIIQGKPVVGANIIAAKIKMSGYDYKITRIDNTGCSITFLGKDGKQSGISSFLEQDAKDAGLLGKDNWKKYARNMYFARAISNGMRWFCPDATSGTLVYTPDELDQKEKPIDIEYEIEGELVEDHPEDEMKLDVQSQEEPPDPDESQRADIIKWCNDMRASLSETLENVTAFTDKKTQKEVKGISDLNYLSGKRLEITHHKIHAIYKEWEKAHPSHSLFDVTDESEESTIRNVMFKVLNEMTAGNQVKAGKLFKTYTGHTQMSGLTRSELIDAYVEVLEKYNEWKKPLAFEKPKSLVNWDKVPETISPDELKLFASDMND